MSEKLIINQWLDRYDKLKSGDWVMYCGYDGFGDMIEGWYVRLYTTNPGNDELIVYFWNPAYPTEHRWGEAPHDRFELHELVPEFYDQLPDDVLDGSASIFGEIIDYENTDLNLWANVSMKDHRRAIFRMSDDPRC